MNELTQKPKNRAAKLLALLTSHRSVYAGLGACHGYGCLVTGKPELYGAMLILYGILAIRG